MANHQAGQGQGSKGEPLAFLCAQLQPTGMPRLLQWPWWTHNCVRRQDQQALARQPQPPHRLSSAQTTLTKPITSCLTIPTHWLWVAPAAGSSRTLVRLAAHCWPWPWPMARAARSWHGKCVQQRLLRESQHPPLLSQLRLSTTKPLTLWDYGVLHRCCSIQILTYWAFVAHVRHAHGTDHYLPLHSAAFISAQRPSRAHCRRRAH